MQSVARPTLAEVARNAGVDKSTASRALRGDAAISSATRDRVCQIAELMGYVPNASARRLSQARTHVISFVSRFLNDVGDPFFAELLSVIAQRAATYQYDILVSCPQDDIYEMDSFKRIMGGNHADGVILMDLRVQDPRLDFFCAQRYPHVLFGRSDLDMRRAYRYPYPWVEVDNRAGTRMGIEYLASQGHTRIAFIGGEDGFICEIDRHQGYLDAITACKLETQPDWRVKSVLSEDHGYRLASQVLQQQPRPTAILAFSDLMAVGAMRAAQDLGLVVGQDVALMGFDGLGLGAYLTPPLTTLRQPLRLIGEKLVDLLIAQINGTPIDVPHVLLQPELIERASTRGERRSVDE